MNFFVNYDFPALLSGIEHAQLKRLQAFSNQENEAIVVTVAYNRFLSRNLSNYKVLNKYVLNMYDYFQKIDNQSNFDQYRKTPQDIMSRGEYVSYINNNCFEVERGGVHTKTIFLMTNGIFKDQIDKVDIYDAYHNKVRTDYYDIRGFLSMSDIYGQRGGVSREVNYDLEGNVVLDSVYQYDNNNLQIDWSLLWNGKRYFFPNKTLLQAKFYDLINDKYNHNNIFISDRAYETDNGLIAMETQRKMFVFWHNVFVPENGIANVSKPFDTLTNQINHCDVIDGLLAATDKEVNDLKIAVNNKIPVKKMNSYVSQSELMINEYKSFTDRTLDIVTVARIASEKRILLGVEMFYKIHEINPDVRWHIFGYGNDKYLETIREAIQAKHLEKFIIINHYSYILGEIYSKSKIFWLTSKFEGFNMAQMEAQHYGVPTVGFDIDYGPSEAIHNENNGFLVEDDDIQGFIDRTIEILTNEALWTIMSQNAMNYARNYSAACLINQWQEIEII